MYNFAKPPEQMLEDFKKYTAETSANFSNKKISEYEFNLYMARYEYIMGRTYFYANNLTEAGNHYDKGMEFAEKAMKKDENAQSVLIFAENISANCTTKPTSWVISNGAKISGLAKKVLKYDEKNGAAIYMLNAQDIYAPAPFNNIKRGIKIMTEIVENSSYDLDSDDRFNLISSVGYGYSLLKNKNDAEIWLKNSLEIYPENKYIKGLLEAL